MSEADKNSKTMEEIQVEIAFLKAQAARNRPVVNPIPEGTKVRLSPAAHAKLAKSKDLARRRPADRIGTVVGFDRRQGRIIVEWKEPVTHKEPLAPKFIEMVST